ncbi:MAG: biotin--[acetyl-CoA-carboxylase] ligase [Candidatus Cryptobacteroides sp.]
MKVEIPIRWAEVVDSTNSWALRDIDSIDNLSVYAARFQTAGRGQRGNKWHSAIGENLTFSIGLRFGNEFTGHIKAIEQFVITEVSALAVADFLSAKGAGVNIKWPNDIYVRDRKICGMLIENSLRGDELATSIIGIGINLKQRYFPPELINPTSLVLATGKEIEPEEALGDFLPCFLSRMKMSLTAEGRMRLRKDYLDILYRKDKTFTYRDNVAGVEFEGTIKGISNIGELLVEMPDKSFKSFSFKEIGYII